MGITNDGYEFHAQNMIGEAVTVFDESHAHIGVGNSETPFDATQTDLQAAAGNRLRKGMDSGYPERSGATLTFQSTFDDADANWAWEEWGIFNADSGGVMHNREVEELGTKTSAVTWIFQVDITLVAS